jgi:hypothetical protein
MTSDAPPAARRCSTWACPEPAVWTRLYQAAGMVSRARYPLCLGCAARSFEMERMLGPEMHHAEYLRLEA